MIPEAFSKRINKAISDSNLQEALDANAERRISVRRQAFATLPNYQELRQSAHAVRRDVIEKLDRYLDQFIVKTQSNGIVVHLAADAEQAGKIVLDIARQHDAKLIAKSKTMVSEEIGLNRVLESAGLNVVETDLGEYIVQLRGEPPSHIITPAVHLRRADVGKTFHEKLGIPLTDEIPVLNAAARSALREVFLTADIGISGVNFGVVETGSLCLLTNEGNGRMVTTVPPVHIALMGIERMVPTLDDLALMLELLPRSATGQTITVYTSLIHGPRRHDDPDGPNERHLILLDNGRMAIRKSPLAESLYCIRCGACLNACPVFREIGGHAYVNTHDKGSTYPGPIGSVVSPALFGQEEFGHLARASSLCGACKEACPVDIDLPKLLLRVRAGKIPVISQDDKFNKPNTPGIMKLGLWMYTWIAKSPRMFDMAQRLAAYLSRIYTLFPLARTSRRNGWMRLPAFTGWDSSKDFPQPALKPFRARFQKIVGEEVTIQADQLSEVDLPKNTSEAAKVSKDDRTEGNNHLLEIFKEEIISLSGTFTLCEPDGLGDAVRALLTSRQITSVLSWDDEYLQEGLRAELQRVGIKIQKSPGNGKFLPESIPRAGLTGAIAAVAETGTLVVPGGHGRPLLSSLLSEIHIVILRVRDLYPNLKDVLNLPQVQEASAVALISGPSRTADIEMTLTIGVHGPGELHVFCVK
jgi:L-lactate dehydrogenase complex protein LldF